MFDPKTGKLLGAQVIGKEGVDKRADVFATALKAGMSVRNLENLELAYAPPFGSAKDPVNLAGMAADHVVQGESKNCQWHEISNLDKNKYLILDVRDDDEREEGYIPESSHIPLPELRERIAELPKNKEIITYCQTGQRSYFAARFLAQQGHDTRNLSGAYLTWKVATDK